LLKEKGIVPVQQTRKRSEKGIKNNLTAKHSPRMLIFRKFGS